MGLQFITFTGVDAHTDLDRLQALAHEFPCEWGILFSKDRQGIDPRYPDRSVIERALGTGLRLSAHLCGGYAAQANSGEMPYIDFTGFTRVQVNHRKPNPEVLSEFSQRIGIPVIAQWREASGFPDKDQGISWLFDTSGGNGVRPDAWPKNPSGVPVGYAGGINPDNVAEVIGQIHAVSPAGDYWIDMETGVRTDNWLDLDKVKKVIASARNAIDEIESVVPPRDCNGRPIMVGDVLKVFHFIGARRQKHFMYKQVVGTKTFGRSAHPYLVVSHLNMKSPEDPDGAYHLRQNGALHEDSEIVQGLDWYHDRPRRHDNAEKS